MKEIVIRTLADLRPGFGPSHLREIQHRGQGVIVGEARIVERALGVGPCVLTEAMTLLHDRLASAET